MREEARDFRLISTALSAESRVRTRDEEQEKLSQGSIQTIHQQLYYNLDLLRTALGLQTCALLWLDESGERLKVKELGTDSPHVVEGAISRGRRRAGRDPEGAARRSRWSRRGCRCCRITRAGDGRRVPRRPGRRGARRRAASWSRDRVDARKFEPPDVTLVESAAAQVVRVVQSERVFQARRALEARTRALLPRVGRAEPRADAGRGVRRGDRGARGVCEFDFAAIATYDARRGSHTHPARGRGGRRQAAGDVAQGSVVDRVDGGEEQAGAARGRRLARARRAGVLAPDAHQGLRVAAGGAADRQGRGDGHVHGRGDARGRVPERPARDAGRDRQPGRGLDAERPHVRGAGGAGDDRRADRPGQPPHLPGAVRDACWAAPSATSCRCRCC